MSQTEMFPASDAPQERNPMVRVFGKGPQGKKCRTCQHLYGKRYSKVYYKCRYRNNTGGPATDHSTTWNACAKYDEQEKERKP